MLRYSDGFAPPPAVCSRRGAASRDQCACATFGETLRRSRGWDVLYDRPMIVRDGGAIGKIRAVTGWLFLRRGPHHGRRLVWLEEAEVHPLVASIFAPETALDCFALLFFGGLLLYIVTSGGSYLYFCVLRAERYFPPEQRRIREWTEVKKEWRWSLYNIFGNALLTAPIYVLIVNGRSKVYFRVADHGLPYLLFSIALLLVITELLVYWAHRLLHLPVLYRHLHVYHHQFRVPSPWTSMAFHPLDSFAQAAPHHLCAFLFPLHAGVYFFAILLLPVWSTFNHGRVSWTRVPLLNYTAHHTAHHKFNHYNFGQFFTLCDRAFGTYKDPAGVVYDGAHSAAHPQRPPPSSATV